MSTPSKYRKSTAKPSDPLPFGSHPLLLDKSVFSVAEAALVLNKSMDTVIRYCKKGVLLAQPVEFGKKKTYQIARQTLLIYLYEQTQREQVERVKKETAAPPPPPEPDHADYLKRFRKTLETGFERRVYSPRTIDDYFHYLDIYFAKYERISADNLEDELMAFAHTKAAKVHYYKAVHCFARYLVQKKVLPEETLLEIKRLKPPENKNPKRHVIRLPEMLQLEAICETPLERFILRLLAYTGIRVSEACQLNWGDIDWEEAELTIWQGKGNKARHVSIPSMAMETLKAYRDSVAETAKEWPLMLNREGKRMTPRGIHDRLEVLGKRAGLKVHPHALRRAFVTISANHGIPMVALQHQCGHIHISTTSKYLRTSEQEALEITKKIDW